MKLFRKVSTAKEGAEVSTMLTTITSPDFALAQSTVWDAPSVANQNATAWWPSRVAVLVHFILTNTRP